MEAAIQAGRESLRRAGGLPAPAAGQALTYIFPLRLAPGLPDYAGHKVSAFPDHNPASGQVLDYAGGSRTYDGHRGTDYALWPFGWDKLETGALQVVAAAAGTILASANADPTDHNCASSSDPWNYVALVHADGRMTIYGHLRYNSLTSKGPGQAVAQGEYLGTAASSGNSSGPHLHFEVRTGSFSNAEWVDPYAGPKSQPESLWASQRPYPDPAINKLATHSAPPAAPDPCQAGTPNLQDSFVTPARIYFYAYYRDYQGALSTQLKIYRPDGSLYTAWQSAPAGSPFYPAWSQGWVYEFSAGSPAGSWRFEAAYKDQVYETFFNLDAPPAVTLTSPNGGEQWNAKLAHPLTWVDNFGGNVNITLIRAGGFSAPIAYNTPSSSPYLWTPGPDLAPGPGYKVRLSSAANPAVYDESDQPFTLAADLALSARDDFALTAANTPVTIYPLSNDQGPAGETLVITALGTPASGQASSASPAVVYSPAPDFLGTDTFTYTVSTSTASAGATVTIRVTAEIFRFFLPISRP